MPDEIKRGALTKDLLGYINETPFMLSLLYDMDLLPEQLTEGSFHWGYMMGIVWSHKNRKMLSEAENNNNE